MLTAPFAFYRGAALIMARDLAATPDRACGPSSAAMRTSPTGSEEARRLAALGALIKHNGDSSSVVCATPWSRG